ncbi:LysE type translocator [compost metagenome]
MLTASNPLTIIFWGGVFSAEAASKKLSRLQLFWFGMGCVLATVMFLSGIAVLGSMANTFLPEKAIQVLNAAVGLVLIAFGIKLLLRRDQEG